MAVSLPDIVDALLKQFEADPSRYLTIGAAVIGVLVLVRRVPLIGALVNLAVMGALIVTLVLVVDQHQRFDPYFGKLTRALDLDDQQVEGKTLRVRMSRDGHFWVRAKLGGIERRMLVDSGATVTALSAATAGAAGLSVTDGTLPTLIRTANGTIRAGQATIPELAFGNIVARNLAVVVFPAFGDVDVLGMNFLSRLKSWRVEGTTLVLEPNHPQQD